MKLAASALITSRIRCCQIQMYQHMTPIRTRSHMLDFLDLSHRKLIARRSIMTLLQLCQDFVLFVIQDRDLILIFVPEVIEEAGVVRHRENLSRGRRHNDGDLNGLLILGFKVATDGHDDRSEEHTSELQSPM